jgi:hypothetical protein
MSNNAQTNRPSGEKNRESAIKYVVIYYFLLLKLQEVRKQKLRLLIFLSSMFT